MPLKHPTEIPKIPKTRNKKAEVAIAAIPTKKPDKIEYVCKAFFYYDTVNKKQFVSFTIETVMELKVFSYEVTVEVLKKKDGIYLVIMGLAAKTNYAPQVQPARKDNYFENLVGDVTVNVVKQDGSINSAIYNINFLEKKIMLVKEFLPEKENNRKFCNFIVAEEENSFKES